MSLCPETLLQNPARPSMVQTKSEANILLTLHIPETYTNIHSLNNLLLFLAAEPP